MTNSQPVYSEQKKRGTYHPLQQIHCETKGFDSIDMDCTKGEAAMLRPSGDKTREELDKLLHTDNVISMRLLCIEFDSELLFAAACSTWLHSVTRLEYVVDPDLFPH